MTPQTFSVFFSLLIFLTGCGVSLSRPPDTQPLAVNYLPGLVKGKKPAFPPARILVLLPIDKRKDLAVRDGTLPIAGDTGEIIGIHGLSSKEGKVRIAARNRVPALGVQRQMDSGMTHPPDVPQTIYTLPGLPEVVQEAISSHFCEAGFHVKTVPFPLPATPAGEEQEAEYALGCTLEEISLLSLVRYQQILIPSFPSPRVISVPIRGPTRAAVSLALSLYHWPSGEMLWQGKVGDTIDDPISEDFTHLYGSAEETLTAALSRAVGSILITQSLQDVLLHEPSSVGSPARGSPQVYPSREKCGSMPQK